jgi:CRP-like cAMP-binding protein
MLKLPFPDPRPQVAQSALFRGLPPEATDALCAAATFKEVPRASYFLHQGEPATVFYILLQGRVRLTQVTPEGHQVIVTVLGPGDGLGIIVALSQTNYPVSAEAIEDCTALAWTAATIQQYMLEFPQLTLNGMNLLARRFVELQDRFRELATERVERRVARAVLRLVRQAGKRTPEGVLIDMPLSRQDLAEMTGTTLYTVSRILSDWEQKGLVSTGRERVVLRKSHELVIIAEDLPEPNPTKPYKP